MSHQEKDFRRFSEALREAFRRVRSASLPEDERARLIRRLLAVTRSARRDVHAAARQLERVSEQLSRLREPRRRGRTGRD
jgi:hypothetical protein